MKWLPYCTLGKCNNIAFEVFFRKHKFSILNSRNLNVETKIKNYNEINDENYKDLLNKEQTFLFFGYANYSNSCLSTFQKIIKIENELRKQLKMENAPIPLIYKLNIDKNYKLVKNFHIKNIPVIQLRHQKKLIEEISGNEIKEANIKNIMNRLFSYFKPIEFVERLDDFIRRDAELLLQKKNDNALEKIKNDINNIKGEMEGKEKKEIISKTDILTNLEIKYQCDAYSAFKKLELALNEIKETKNVNYIKNLLNDILINYNTYLDINNEYVKLVARGFVYLFDESNLSLENVINLKNSIILNNHVDSKIFKCLTFNEPVIMFDHYKTRNLNKVDHIDKFLSQEDKIIIEIDGNSSININNKQQESQTRTKYLSRIFRILTVKYFDMNNFQNSLYYALESYKATFPLNNMEHMKSKVLAENILLFLGAYNESVQNFKSELEFLYTNHILKEVRFPHTRAIKGGRPIMKRGKSGKWRWLSHDWKPRWVKKKIKNILEEEWGVVTDKNVPFWN